MNRKDWFPICHLFRQVSILPYAYLSLHSFKDKDHNICIHIDFSKCGDPVERK